MSSLNDIIDAFNLDPIEPEREYEDKPLLATAYELTDQTNESLPDKLKISKATIQDVVRRELPNEAKAYRSVINFLSTVENPKTQTPTTHTDLLHPGHPLSTQNISTFRLRRASAEYFSNIADAHSDEARTLLASAITSEPDSAARLFYSTLLEDQQNGLRLLSLIGEADESLSKKGYSPS